MFKSVRIKGFRGIDDLALDFKRVNLIVGKNNVGKTTVLEALYLLLGGHAPELTMKVEAFRGRGKVMADPLELWGWLYPWQEPDRPIAIHCVDVNSVEHSLEIALGPPRESTIESTTNSDQGSVPVTELSTVSTQQFELSYKYENSAGEHHTCKAHISGANIISERAERMLFPKSMILVPAYRTGKEEAERFAKLEKKRREDEVVAALRVVEPAITRIFVSVSGGEPTLFCDLGGKCPIPLAYQGGGTMRLAGIILAILDCPGGVVLIDEIDIGLHHSVMQDVWKVILSTAERSNTQVIATTHNEECVMYASAAVQERLPPSRDFRLHRMEGSNGQVKVVQVEADQLATAVRSGMEVR